MCLYPRKMINKKYTVTEKNGGCVPTMPITGKDEYGHNIYDTRIAYVQIPCGHCSECRKEKSREWQVRLTEEIREQWKYKYFVTLTFSNQALINIHKKTGLGQDSNDIAKYAVRHMLEKYRKQYKHSLRHWLITELGHEGTERIHLHGILFSNEKLEFEPTEEKYFYTWKHWKYGNIYVGDYVTTRTVNYIIKYVNKIDKDHPGFEGKILTSPGIGKSFLEREISKTYKYIPKQSKDYYRLENGAKIALPTYYKNKRYNENERELIWREKMDQQEQKEIIAGNIYDLHSTRTEELSNVLNKAQEINIKLGYGDNSAAFRKRNYSTWNMLSHAEKLEILEKNRKKIQKNLHKSK